LLGDPSRLLRILETPAGKREERREADEKR
jgi:hypothetical protein